MLDFIILVEACLKKVDIYIFINNLLYGEVIKIWGAWILLWLENKQN